MNLFMQSVKAAGSGIREAVRTERNFRIHLVVAAIVLVATVWLRLRLLEVVIVILCIGLVLIFELFNSALERLSDLISPGHDPKIKLVKDMGAGAVLVSAVTSAVVGLLVFLPHLN